jgi:polygalacturonase
MSGIFVSAREHNILDFGAKADTAFLSTKAIQQAIDECSKSGGKVIVPAGKFKTGTIYLKSNVTLHLENGATIYGSKHLSDYPENNPDFVYFRKYILKRALFYAEKCTNFAIEGEGSIDGQGAAFWIPEGVKVESYSVRPYIFWMIQCSDIRVEGIKLRNSAFWMQHYIACDNLYIHNVEVFNHCNKNNDMIDIDGCHNVRISDFTGDSDDDGITFKSTTGRANENVVIANCILSSHCNAIKMGTESSTGFKNIAISNIVVRPSKIADKSINGTPKGHSGIALETVDGGFIDGVVISNIRIDGPVCPIFIRRGFRARPYYQGQKIERPGELKNISINNLVATGAGKTGCSITGIPGYPVENISLSNISIEFEGGSLAGNVNTEVPEEVKSYPEFDMFGDLLPSFGFFVRHAENIRFSDVQLKTKTNDERPAICLSDVHNSTFKNTSLENAGTNDCNILLENSTDILISGSTTTGKSEVFAKLKGVGNKNIIIANNLLPGIKQIFSPENGGEKVVRESGNLK